jgi:hypothetical protein
VTALDPSETGNRLEPLARFVGTWTIEASFPGDPPVTMGGGRSLFEWMDGGQFLIQRVDIPDSDVPNSICIVGAAAGHHGYLQHYFDTRGIARLYGMTLVDDEWTLTRESPDFSPLEFRQRFTGAFSQDGETILGAWEKADPASPWTHDFDLKYTRTS